MRYFMSGYGFIMIGLLVAFGSGYTMRSTPRQLQPMQRSQQPHSKILDYKPPTSQLYSYATDLYNESSIVTMLNSLPQISYQYLVQQDPMIQDIMSKSSSWFGSSFNLNRCTCKSIEATHLAIEVNYTIKSAPKSCLVSLNFTSPVYDDESLKIELLSMFYIPTSKSAFDDTAAIASLPFGDDYRLPTNFRFNDVPHATWVRAYLNDLAKNAVVDAIYNPRIKNKSRLQMKLNFPEVNPAFDTYRIGTVLELVRHIALDLAISEGE
jgi:hypothetical protein